MFFESQKFIFGHRYKENEAFRPLWSGLYGHVSFSWLCVSFPRKRLSPSFMMDSLYRLSLKELDNTLPTDSAQETLH